MEKLQDKTLESCRDFVARVASSEPAPGGGGAAALVGAVGTALGNMVGSLTVGKRKYAADEAELQALMDQCQALETQLLDQVAADEAGFLPLAKAYGIPKDDPTRPEILSRRRWRPAPSRCGSCASAARPSTPLPSLRRRAPAWLFRMPGAARFAARRRCRRRR